MGLKKYAPGIYQIRNTLNNKVYIGSAICISARWSRHRKELSSNTHPNQHLQSSWNKYGEKAFLFEIIENGQEKTLIEREQFWIDSKKASDPNTGFNQCPKAGSTLNRVLTDEQRLRATENINKIREGTKTRSAQTKRSITRREKGTRSHKLNWEKVQEIRRRYSSEKISFQQLALEYNVGVVTIHDLIHNKTWKPFSQEELVLLQESSKENISEETRREKLSSPGEKNPNCKLSDEVLKKLREEAQAGSISRRDLAKKYNISYIWLGRLLNPKMTIRSNHV